MPLPGPGLRFFFLLPENVWCKVVYIFQKSLADEKSGNPPPRLVGSSQRHIEDVCNISRPESKKRRGQSLGNTFRALYLTQPVRVIIEKKRFFCDLALPHCNAVFFLTLQRSVFFPHFVVFEAHVSSDCDVGNMNNKMPHPGIPSLPPCIQPVYTSTRRISGNFVNIYHHRDSDGEKCLNWPRGCWAHT